MNYFEYNGVRSSEMGLRIERKDVFSAPGYDVKFQSIPGRNGDLILPNGRYPNAQVTYTVFLPAKSLPELAQKITAVKAWLYTEPDRYHTLSDTYDTAYFRKAVFSGKLKIEEQLNKIGVFTITFSCQPFRYSAVGQVETIVKSGGSLTNDSPFSSAPYIRLDGSGKGTLTIQASGHNEIWNFTGINGYIEIDSEQMNFYKGAELKNDTVTGSGFPTLYPGKNTISYSGGITKATVIPRWVML